MVHFKFMIPIQKSNSGELLFPASVIDGTGLSIAEFLSKELNSEDRKVKLCICFIQEFYKLLSISVQTNTEEEFEQHLNKIFEVYRQGLQ